MADTVVNSLKKLARAKTKLQEKEQVVARTEQRLLEHLNDMLPGIGYRLVPVTSGGQQSRAVDGIDRAKRLRCVTCKRRFRLPLHLARHVSATHGTNKRPGKATSAGKKKSA